MREQEWQGVLDIVGQRATTEARTISDDELSQAILKLEDDLGFPLTDEYRTWLEHFAYVEIDCQSFFGFSRLDSLSEVQFDWISRGWLAVASDRCGNYYVLVHNGEFGLPAPVIFIDMIRGIEEAYIFASSFPKFIQGSLEGEKFNDSVEHLNTEEQLHLERTWPFNPNIAREFDPDIFLAKNIHLPWHDDPRFNEVK